MKHDFSLKQRKDETLPPEKLYTILRGIWPKNVADEKYTMLTGLNPPKEEVEIKKVD